MGIPPAKAMVLVDKRLQNLLHREIDNYISSVEYDRGFDLDLRIIDGIDDWTAPDVKSLIKDVKALNTDLEGVLFVGNIRILTLCFYYGATAWKKGFVASFYDDLDATFINDGLPSGCAAP